MAQAAPAQMMMDLVPLMVEASEDDAVETAGRKRITSVQILAQERPWWAKGIADDAPYQVVAVFRNHSRLYRSYEYRPGLRHDRAVRVCGRR